MFKLYLPVYKNTLEAYKKVEEPLIEEKEKQAAIINSIQGRRKGDAAESYIRLYNEFLTTGECGEIADCGKCVYRL